MARRERIAALALATLAWTTSARADVPSRDPLAFVVGPHMGVEPTARTVDGVTRLLQRYDDALPERVIPGDGFGARAMRYLGRSLQLVFVDGPLAELSTLFVHEVGGHGARARELDVPVSFEFRIPAVYRPFFETRSPGDYSGYSALEARGPVEGDTSTLFDLGGIEANHTTARWVMMRMVRDEGRFEKGDALVFAASKLSYAQDFVDVSSAVGSGNDVASYVTDLQEVSNAWRREDRARIARRIESAYLMNLLDPTLFYAGYAALEAVVRGERTSHVPLPSIGDVVVHPTPRFALSPSGAENGLGVTLAKAGAVLDVYGQVGTTGLFASQSFGARVLGVTAHPRVTLGAELDVWRRPQLFIAQQDRFVFERPTRGGANAALFADVRLSGPVGLTGKLGVKSEGFLSAQPIASGVYGYAGLRLAL